MVLLGVSAPAFALFVFYLISMMNWAPRDAKLPVRFLSFTYAVLALPFTWYLLAGRPKLNGAMEETSDARKSPVGRKFES